MSWSGSDWMCGYCRHVNFKNRESCQVCGCYKFGGETDGQNRFVARPGDWYCAATHCQAHNYAKRKVCYKCGASNMTGSGVPPGWKPGDWLCTRCNGHNYASRTECYSCQTPRNFGGAV